jgi:hypothetical protein
MHDARLMSGMKRDGVGLRYLSGSAFHIQTFSVVTGKSSCVTLIFLKAHPIHVGSSAFARLLPAAFAAVALSAAATCR